MAGNLRNRTVAPTPPANLRSRTTVPTPKRIRTVTEWRVQLNKWLSTHTPTPRQNQLIAMYESYLSGMAFSSRPTVTFLSEMNTRLDTILKLLG